MAGSSLSVPVIQSWLPGVHLLRTYDTRNLSSDVVAGLSVAAVAIPIGIAYAQLAGAPPGPLMAAVASILAVYLLSLNASGVRIIGTIPSGLPSPHGGVVVAVGLAMVKLLMLASKPHDAVLARRQERKGL